VKMGEPFWIVLGVMSLIALVLYVRND